MIPQYAEEVRKTRVSSPKTREPKVGSLQWWARQVFYALIVLTVMFLGALLDAPW